MRQFHLQATLRSSGAAGENIQDELGSVNDARTDGAFEVALLSRRQIVIHDHGIGFQPLRKLPDFFDFALAEQSCSFDFRANLKDFAGNGRTGAEGEFFQFQK